MQLTQLLQRLETGDPEAIHIVMPLVYDELKKLARAHLRTEMRSLPLDTTSLVHEAFLKLARGRHPSYENRSHFYGIASRLMRQILVDAARAQTTGKRGAAQEVPIASLPDLGPQPERPLLALDDALKSLEQADPQKGRLIEMRYFAGMTAEESATVLGIPVATVRRELRLAQAWLRREMSLLKRNETGPAR